MLRLLDTLGKPQNKLDTVVHVAGTNGKGSVIAYMKAVLEAAGKSVNVFTSPHLVNFHERFVLHGREISENVLCDVLLRVETANKGEPITFFEYMFDTARLAKENGIHNILISNGYINRKPLLELCQFLDAANINIKSLSDTIYRKLNGGRLKPVLDTFKTLHEQGVHFEMTNLVVPGYTDNENMIMEICQWIISNLGPNYPLHFLRFFPKYKLDRLPSTPLSTLIKFRKIAMSEGIRYAYVGNVSYPEGNNTYCHKCKKLLIERTGYFIPTYNMDGNRCQYCQTIIPGQWI